MDDLRRICANSRVFLRGEAIAHGYEDDDLRRAMRHGQLHRVRQGAYVFTEDWEPLDDAAKHLVSTAAVLRQARTELVLSHTTAAVAHDLSLWDLGLDEVHVTRTDRRAGRRETGVCQHKGRLDEIDRVQVHGVPVTSPARTVIDLATTTDVVHTLVVADQVVRRQLATPAELRSVAGRLDRTPHSLRTRLVTMHVDGRSESVGETRARYMFWRGGLPRPLLQHPILDANGTEIARVDFAWPELGVFLEFDGMVKYEKLLQPGERASDVVVREKQREQRICLLTGWRCIRITWADLYTPELTCRRIRDFLFASSAA